MLFLFARCGGRLSDRYGRLPVIVIGLVGFASILALFAMAGSHSSLYFGRFHNGASASSTAPSAYALVEVHNAADLGWRGSAPLTRTAVPHLLNQEHQSSNAK